MSSLFKVHSFLSENRDVAFYFFFIAILKRLAILTEPILKIYCCIKHAFISDDKLSIHGHTLNYIQKLCESGNSLISTRYFSLAQLEPSHV